MYQIYKWRYLYACINSLSWINVSNFVAHCIITNSVAPPLHLILRITHHHTIFFQACGCKGQMHTSGQAVITFISPQITDKTAYMIESEANTCACEQGVVLKRKRPNLSMDRRAWWGVLSHFWEASGSWWSGTTTRQIAFASYCHASRKGCIGIVIVTVHLSETERKKGKWEREREKQTESQRVCAEDDTGCTCVCVWSACSGKRGRLACAGGLLTVLSLWISFWEVSQSLGHRNTAGVCSFSFHPRTQTFH